ncbi:MAG: hypothetical protein Q7R56_00710 [Nanoarchaeota archaeon]|nr:hypothetical protein [Nanoarchaeota archaeon]
MKRGFFNNNNVMLAAIIVVVALVIYTSGIIKKDCGRDKLCFRENLEPCKTAKLITIKNDNVYSYTIQSSFGNTCTMEVKMERIALGADPQFERLLEHKSMLCNLPREQLETTDPDDFNSFIDTCSGPLKEGLYELVIQRMYTVVVKELDGILQQSRKALLDKI